ncbi:MAG: CRISPR-associated protein Cas4 [Betaproteobacteria bacterium]
MAEPSEPIMLSAIEHYSYCPRQYALIHIEQAFDHNVHTKRGDAVHERVDDPGVELREGVRIERALPVWSETLGLIGKCDIVEFDRDGTPYPIEYKHGPKRVKEHDDLQLAAQALCLEEMTGKSVPKGAIYHFSSRRRREIIISEPLRERVTAVIANIRAIRQAGALPPPVNDKRCDQCSLKEICQPQATANADKRRQLVANLYGVDDEKLNRG